MKILFLHGWRSVPGGVKPTYLKDHGHEVVNPALPDDDFAGAVGIAQAAFDRHRPDVVVGSSRGGAVALTIDTGTTPLVLLCPAWKKFGTARTVKANAAILHSRADDVVPFADSVELARASGLPAAALIEVGTDHRLADPEPLAAMLKACEQSVSSNQPTRTEPPEGPPVTRLPTIRPTTAGRTVAVVGDVYRFLATGEDTNGAYALWEAVVPPGGGPPPHVHSREEEGFYVLDGEITFVVDGKPLVATAGTFANMPVGVPHSFRNESNRPARMLISVAPAGLEQMFFECGVPVPQGTTTAAPPAKEEIETLLRIAPRYGIEIRLPGH